MSNKQIKYLFPYKITPVDPKINEDLLKYFKGERTGFVQVGPQNYIYPWKYINAAEAYYNFEARPDDIWINTIPRSGTTWTQELIWLISNNLDYETAQREPLINRFPFFEYPIFIHEDVKQELLNENSDDPIKQELIKNVSRPTYEYLNKIQKQRFIKTHFPPSLLPPSVMEQKCKIIYVARNPKDVAISFYHLNRSFRSQEYVGDFARYWNYFENGHTYSMPYWSHIKEGWAYRHHPNVLFIFYEDIKHKFPEMIRK